MGFLTWSYAPRRVLPPCYFFWFFFTFHKERFTFLRFNTTPTSTPQVYEHDVLPAPSLPTFLQTGRRHKSAAHIRHHTFVSNQLDTLFGIQKIEAL
jgi:hypothetical protein